MSAAKTTLTHCKANPVLRQDTFHYLNKEPDRSWHACQLLLIACTLLIIHYALQFDMVIFIAWLYLIANELHCMHLKLS